MKHSMVNPLYAEKYRPRFHFSAREKWLNDPNGCVFFDGEYHLFFQHNPDGNLWGNMTWGHAVSPDLVHWKQLDNAILPYDGGDIFSGSAVWDRENRSGLGVGDSGPLVAAFTHSKEPTGQCMAFSNDRGRTWKLYNEGRHVVPNQGLDPIERDPKIFWYEPSSLFVMVLWVKMGQIRFFTSANLLDWDYGSDFEGEGFFECPDLVKLPVDGNCENTKWLLYDGALTYWIGEFDGTNFTPESGPLQGEHGENFFAGQTWNNTKDRIVQIGWMRGGEYPEMPFNQQMSFPCELSLSTTSSGVKLCRNPVPEITSLYEDSASANGASANGASFDICGQVELSQNDSLKLSISGHTIDIGFAVINCMGKVVNIQSPTGVIDFRILVDKTSIEFFGIRGEICISTCFLSDSDEINLSIGVGMGIPRIHKLEVHSLASAWTGKCLSKNEQ